MQIGNIEIKNGIFLAPMAGVTDAAFREVCREKGAELSCSEMVSAKALCYQDRKTRELMMRGRDEYPFAVQIFGSDISCMREAAKKVMETASPEIIDINMGCPVGKVVRAGDGSALMLKPELAAEIISAVAEAVNVPVTVKFRKGFDGGHINAVEFAKMCEASGAAAITVHGRTRVQMYSGKADRDIIRDVKKAVSIPVIANGDIFCGEDAKKMPDYTGADGIMIARGAMGNPWIFTAAKAAMCGEAIPREPSVREKLETAIHQFERSAEMRGEHITCIEARKHLAWYMRGMPHAAFYRGKVMAVETLKDICNVARDIIDSAKGEGGSERD